MLEEIIKPQSQIELFGNDSLERITDGSINSNNENKEEIINTIVNYIPVSYRCEPLGNAKLKKEIITKFCKNNGLELPKGFYKKNAEQVHGMFSGMTRRYGKLYTTFLYEFL